MNKIKRLSVYDIALIAVFMAVISVCSFITVPFAIPFTMQVFGVFFAVGILGGKKGAICVLAYLLLGFLGAPIFSGFQGGFQKLMEPTGGFLVGFLVSAVVSGFLVDKLKPTFLSFLLSFFTGLAVCYVCEVIWLVLFLSFDFIAAFLLVAPFVIPDFLKIIIAAFLSVKLRKFVR